MNIIELLNKNYKFLTDYYEKSQDYYNFFNKDLTSLYGLPDSFNNDIDLEHNRLTSLEGLPENFNSELDVNDNQLINLEGLPENFNAKIYLYNNPIESLDGLNDVLLPKNIYGLDKDFIVSEYIRLGKHHLLI